MTTLANPTPPALLTPAGQGPPLEATADGPAGSRVSAPAPTTATPGVDAPKAAKHAQNARRRTWAGRNLDQPATSPHAMATLALTGLALAGTLGLAMGMVGGPLALPGHVWGAMWTLLTVVLFALPGLTILLTLFDAPITPLTMANWAAEAMFSAGLVYAGLAPLVALYAVTAPHASAGLVGLGSAALGGAHGLLHLKRRLDDALSAMPTLTRLRCKAVVNGFGLFAMLLALRALVKLPLLGGGL